MGKIGGLALVAVLGLTGCAPSAQAEVAPAVKATVAATAAVTAAPIDAKPAPAPETAKTGTFGDPATDAKYLAGVKGLWSGELPSDASLISGAKFACQEFASGKKYTQIYAVAGAPEDMAAWEKSQRVAVYASRNYCVEYNTDKG